MDLELSALVRIITNGVEYDWFSPYKKNSGYESVGTGFFIDMDGYILTCAHVVEDAIKLSIIIPAIGKEKFSAEIISICPETDIALLRAVNYKNKSYLKLGDSDSIKPKDHVTAIGYPLGQDRLKYTSGIVSGIQGSLIQTDAPINPGNSGGPLVDKDNLVVGINSSKMTDADNVGFSVPIQEYKLLKDIMHTGDVKVIHKPKLYADFNNVDDNALKYTGSKCPSGYMIKKLYKISPLYMSGLREGDIICSFDGKKLDNYGETNVPWSTQKVHLKELMERYKTGDRIKVDFWSRNTDVLQTKDVILKTAKGLKIKKHYAQFEDIDYEIINGCIIMQLTKNHLNSRKLLGMDDDVYDNLNRYYDIELRFQPRLIITKVFGGSYAGNLDNIKYGEILTHVNHKEVSNLKEFRDAMLEPVDGKYIIFNTELNNLMVNTIQDLLNDEDFLAEEYGYKKSKLCAQLDKILKGGEGVYKHNKQVPIKKNENLPLPVENDDSTMCVIIIMILIALYIWYNHYRKSE